MSRAPQSPVSLSDCYVTPSGSSSYLPTMRRTTHVGDSFQSLREQAEPERLLRQLVEVALVAFLANADRGHEDGDLWCGA